MLRDERHFLNLVMAALRAEKFLARLPLTGRASILPRHCARQRCAALRHWRGATPPLAKRAMKSAATPSP